MTSNTTFTAFEDEVYRSLPEYRWEKYQRGFLGILNNAYNQSCNSGTKTLGDMSEITNSFDGGSYRDFLDFYAEHYDGERRVEEAIERMCDNLIARVESVGGTLSHESAYKWSKRYIFSMLVNSYRGFLDEERAIELVARYLDEDWSIAGPDEESAGIDGYVGDKSVQVKPESHNSLDINSYNVDALITYEYDDGVFTVTYKEV